VKAAKPEPRKPAKNPTERIQIKIAELKPGMRRVDVKGKIVDIENPREVNTKFGPGQVANATLQDESGTVKVTLWNENISKIAVNDNVEIQNGYVESFRGELQLNVGRYGKLAKV
jgi:replication factor A1